MDLSFLGPSAASVIIVVTFLKYMSDENKRSERRHTEMIKTINHNTLVTKKTNQTMTETVRYLKHRNGAFEKLIKEQPLIHQIVKEHFEDEPK